MSGDVEVPESRKVLSRKRVSEWLGTLQDDMAYYDPYEDARTAAPLQQQPPPPSHDPYRTRERHYRSPSPDRYAAAPATQADYLRASSHLVDPYGQHSSRAPPPQSSSASRQMTSSGDPYALSRSRGGTSGGRALTPPPPPPPPLPEVPYRPLSPPPLPRSSRRTGSGRTDSPDPLAARGTSKGQALSYLRSPYSTKESAASPKVSSSGGYYSSNPTSTNPAATGSNRYSRAATGTTATGYHTSTANGGGGGGGTVAEKKRLLQQFGLDTSKVDDSTLEAWTEYLQQWNQYYYYVMESQKEQKANEEKTNPQQAAFQQFLASQGMGMNMQGMPPQANFFGGPGYPAPGPGGGFAGPPPIGPYHGGTRGGMRPAFNRRFPGPGGFPRGAYNGAYSPRMGMGRRGGAWVGKPGGYQPGGPRGATPAVVTSSPLTTAGAATHRPRTDINHNVPSAGDSYSRRSAASKNSTTDLNSNKRPITSAVQLAKPGDLKVTIDNDVIQAAKRINKMGTDVSTNDANEFFCHACNIKCPNLTEFDIHMSGTNHKKRMQDIASLTAQNSEQNYVRAGDTFEREYCGVCDRRFHGSILFHRKSDEHKRKERLSRKGCLLCKTGSFNTYPDYVFHIDCQSHKQEKEKLQIEQRARAEAAGLSLEEYRNLAPENRDDDSLASQEDQGAAGRGRTKGRSRWERVDANGLATNQKSSPYKSLLSTPMGDKSKGQTSEGGLSIMDLLAKMGDVKPTDLTFNPANAVGVDFVVPVKGFFCKLCHKFYNNEEMARVAHCKTEKHFEKFQQLMEYRQKHLAQLKQSTSPAKSSTSAPVVTTATKAEGKAQVTKPVAGKPTVAGAKASTAAGVGGTGAATKGKVAAKRGGSKVTGQAKVSPMVTAAIASSATSAKRKAESGNATTAAFMGPVRGKTVAGNKRQKKGTGGGAGSAIAAESPKPAGGAKTARGAAPKVAKVAPATAKVKKAGRVGVTPAGTLAVPATGAAPDANAKGAVAKKVGKLATVSSAKPLLATQPRATPARKTVARQTRQVPMKKLTVELDRLQVDTAASSNSATMPPPTGLPPKSVAQAKLSRTAAGKMGKKAVQDPDYTAKATVTVKAPPTGRRRVVGVRAGGVSKGRVTKPARGKAAVVSATVDEVIDDVIASSLLEEDDKADEDVDSAAPTKKPTRGKRKSTAAAGVGAGEGSPTKRRSRAALNKLKAAAAASIIAHHEDSQGITQDPDEIKLSESVNSTEQGKVETSASNVDNQRQSWDLVCGEIGQNCTDGDIGCDPAENADPEEGQDVDSETQDTNPAPDGGVDVNVDSNSQIDAEAKLPAEDPTRHDVIPEASGEYFTIDSIVHDDVDVDAQPAGDADDDAEDDDIDGDDDDVTSVNEAASEQLAEEEEAEEEEEEAEDEDEEGEEVEEDLAEEEESEAGRDDSREEAEALGEEADMEDDNPEGAEVEENGDAEGEENEDEEVDDNGEEEGEELMEEAEEAAAESEGEIMVSDDADGDSDEEEYEYEEIEEEVEEEVEAETECEEEEEEADEEEGEEEAEAASIGPDQLPEEDELSESGDMGHPQADGGDGDTNPPQGSFSRHNGDLTQKDAAEVALGDDKEPGSVDAAPATGPRKSPRGESPALTPGGRKKKARRAKLAVT